MQGEEKDIIGKVIFVIPFAGYVLRFVKTYLLSTIIVGYLVDLDIKEF